MFRASRRMERPSAFTAPYDGNTEVYVMPRWRRAAAGGITPPRSNAPTYPDPHGTGHIVMTWRERQRVRSSIARRPTQWNPFSRANDDSRSSAAAHFTNIAAPRAAAVQLFAGRQKARLQPRLSASSAPGRVIAAGRRTNSVLRFRTRRRRSPMILAQDSFPMWTGRPIYFVPSATRTRQAKPLRI